MEDETWFCRTCTYRNERPSSTCSMCDSSRPSSNRPYARSSSSQPEETNLYAGNIYEESAEYRSPWRSVVRSILRLVLSALAWATVSMLATAGILSGAVVGAFRGQASESGLLHGAGLGAVIGTLLAFEFLEILWAFWNSERRLSRTSMAELLENVLSGRFIEEHVGPAMLAAYHWQVNNMTYEELYEMFGASGGIKGASEVLLKNLPWHTILDNGVLDSNGERLCCPICLQEFEHGETSRCLPYCQHTFHKNCVDKWLILHGSCPVCRKVI